MFYTIECRSVVDFGERVVPRANGTLVWEGEHYFARMQNQELIDNVPVFDHFFLQTTDTLKPETWEWLIQDVHRFSGREKPPIIGWFISDYFRQVLEQFVIAPPYRFYPAKLKYKNSKLDYFIFNLLWIKLETIIDFDALKFSIAEGYPKEKVGPYNQPIRNKSELDEVKISFYKQKKELQLDSVVVTEYFDFVPLYGINSDIIITERLKQAIEKSRIEGVIIKEAPYQIRMKDQA